MRRPLVRRFSIALLVLAIVLVGIVSAAPAAANSGGFFTLTGDAAANFVVPGDTQLVTTFTLDTYGLTYARYQQTFRGASVLGGQITLYRDAEGTIATVIGSHYPGIVASNAVGLSKAAARGIVSRDIGAAGQRLVTFSINPANGRFFYRVETRRADRRWIHWIDASSGAILNKYDALAYNCDGASAPCGFGVQYSEDASDVKDLSGLTTPGGSQYQLISSDSRQETHDQGSSRRPFLGPVATDADNSWVLTGNESPAQQALVDAQYYANVTDDYYLAVHGFDWVGRAQAKGANDRMEIHAHFTYQYDNAYWNGSYIALGDGDQITFEELTAMDVVGHELTHGVTEFTSDLIYQDESGALNEAFSDMMGNTMEFWAEANGREPATSLGPDWYVGEDFDLTNDAVPGFRNMEDPTEDGDPSHYADRYTGTSDNGGVHTNSGIANHWYYLLVNGGQNADPDRASGTDVTGIGLPAAEQIAFLGFTALPADATFCNARASTVAVAGGFDANTSDAWDEVGVDAALCGGGNSAPTADFTYTTSGLTAYFTDQSTDSDGSIASWSWDFGDGSTSTVQNPSHSYAAGGTYTVGLTVTDDGGASDSTSQSVSVSDSGGGSTVTVTSVTYTAEGGRDNKKHVNATVTLEDDTGSPVSGASVSVQIDNSDTGQTWSGTGTTDSNGQVTFSIKNAPSGYYTTKVTEVTAAGLTWDGTTPPNGFSKP